MRQGPLSGLKIVEFAGIGPGPFCGMLLSRPGRRRRAHRPQGRRARRSEDRRHRARPPLGGARPEGPGGGRDARCTLMDKRRRGVRGLPAGRDGAAGPRPRRGAEAQSEAGLRPHDRLGPVRAPTPRPPATTSTTSRSPARCTRSAPADKPVPPLNLVGDFGGGALYLAFGLLAGVIHARATGQGQVVDCAMTDGAASLMAMFYGMARHRHVAGPARRQPARRRRAVLRHLRVPPTAAASRSARSSRSSTRCCWRRPGSTTRPFKAQMDRADWPDAEGQAGRRDQDQDPRRVVRDHGRHRRLLRAGARHRRGAQPPAQRRAQDLRRGRGRRAAGARAALLGHSRRDPGPAAGDRRPHDDVLADWGVAEPATA